MCNPDVAFSSHNTHMGRYSRGIKLNCLDCHAVHSGHLFADGADTLADTTVCNGCHSPDGVFDGSNDPVIGAKANWQTGVYNAEGTELQAGLENWCATCHDDGTSICLGVSAPNVMGDNATYGYNVSGHKIACSACHNLATNHIDGEVRTYRHDSNPWDPNDISNYQNGYRLKFRMIIPLGVGPLGGIAQNRYELCFTCHDYSRIMGNSTPFMTNFQDDDINRHFYHLSSGRYSWDSDWDYLDTLEDTIIDSRISCTACHNVHGSPSPAMIRHGELISTPGTTNKVPALSYRWYKEDGYTPTILGEESFFADMPVLGGPGGGAIEDSMLCIGCHGGPNPIKYDRVYQTLSKPVGTWAKLCNLQPSASLRLKYFISSNLLF